MITLEERAQLDRLRRAGVDRRTRQLFLVLARTVYAGDNVPDSARSTMRITALPLLASVALETFHDSGEV